MKSVGVSQFPKIFSSIALYITLQISFCQYFHNSPIYSNSNLSVTIIGIGVNS